MFWYYAHSSTNTTTAILPTISPRPSPRQALFEAIVPPTEGSEEATLATDKPSNVGFDEYLEDDFDGLDWDDFPQYMKPLASYRQKKSWIYNHG